jgi:hypothetical protein
LLDFFECFDLGSRECLKTGKGWMICSYFPVTNLFNNPELCSDMFDTQPYAIGMLLLGVPSCEQYPSQPLFPNLWGSNIHWVGLGVTGNNGGFSHEKKGVL